MHRNLEDDAYTKKIAEDKLKSAWEIYLKMRGSNKSAYIRTCAGYIIMILAETIAIYHHDYFHFGLKKQLEDLKSKFPDLPGEIVSDYEKVVRSENDEEYLENSLRMLEDTGKYLEIMLSLKNEDLQQQKNYAKRGVEQFSKPDYMLLAGMYEEISSTFNKIYVCCENDNDILAFLSAVCLQRDLDEAYEYGCPEYDLLGYYKYNELAEFAKVTHEIEEKFVQFILAGGGKIKSYADFEEFERAKL